MGRKLHIPPPVVKENEDEYLKELSKISEAENWIERHSVHNESNQETKRIIQHDNSRNQDFVYVVSFVVALLILTLGIAFFCLPALVVIFLFK